MKTKDRKFAMDTVIKILLGIISIAKCYKEAVVVFLRMKREFSYYFIWCKLLHKKLKIIYSIKGGRVVED